MRVEEVHSYSQTIAGVRTTDLTEPPRGHLEFVVRYDAHTHVSRGAVQDARRALAGRTEDVLGKVGYLVVADHAATDLAERVRLHGRYLALPLLVPLRDRDLRRFDDIHTDRYQYRERVEYAAASPTLIPVSVNVSLDDPDVERIRRLRSERSFDEHFEELIGTLSEGGAADRRLRLELLVRADVDLPRDQCAPRPVVRRVAVGLPHITSLATSALELQVDGSRMRCQYDPVRGVLEWFDVDMPEFAPTVAETRDQRDTARRAVSSLAPAMVLTVAEPGELLEDRSLVVEVDVELPGVLLSATRVRLFDAAGRPFEDDPLTVRTTVRSRTRVALREAFAARRRAPAQVLHFDEIVPEDRRVSDVVAALRALTFEVSDKRGPQQTDRDTSYWLVLAHRVQGPQRSELTVLVRGRRSATRRKAQQVEGHEYSSRFDSGDLTLFIRGTTQGDDQDLWQRVNELHGELRQRFRPLKAQR